MISCKKAVELMTKSMDEPLSVREVLALKIHNFICEFCEQFKKQLGILRSISCRLPEDGERLSDDAKTRIKKRLEEERKD